MSKHPTPKEITFHVSQEHVSLDFFLQPPFVPSSPSHLSLTAPSTLLTDLLLLLSALRSPSRPIACPNLGSFFSALPLLHSQICSSLRDRSLWAPPWIAELAPRGSRNLAAAEPAGLVMRRATDRPAERPIDRPTRVFGRIVFRHSIHLAEEIVCLCDIQSSILAMLPACDVTSFQVKIKYLNNFFEIMQVLKTNTRSIFYKGHR